MIKITDELYIKATDLQYMLVEPTAGTRTNGEPYERLSPIGYYGTIGAALHGAKRYLMRKKIADETITTLDEVMAEYKRLVEIDAEIINKINV